MQQIAVKNPALYQHLLEFQPKLTSPSRNLRTAALTDTIIRIPVVVHVIHSNAGGTLGAANISDAQILSQIAVLNRDYQRKNPDTAHVRPVFEPVAANCKIEFCLAQTDPQGNNTTGITRTYNPNATSYTINDEEDLKALTYWPSDQYLNIWTCDLRGTPSSQLLLGYSSQPGGLPFSDPNDPPANLDGVVINYKAFGTVGTLLNKFNLGRTTTHEVGHWLGLLHPWGNYDSGFCNLSDYCEDTPPCANSFQAAFSACTDNPQTTCTPATARMIENYMDYSDDGCMNLFTEDQKSRMRAAFSLSPRRKAILSSPGCCTITDLYAMGYEKSFEDGNMHSGGWTTFNPNAASVYTKGFELNGSVSGYGTGSYSASVTNDSVYNQANADTYKYVFTYRSPAFKLQDANIPKLRFDWAYSPLTANGATDSVLVYATTGCSTNRTLLYTFYGSTFTSTDNPRASFVPHADEWRTTEIDLSAYKNAFATHIQFVAYSKGINTFYLDNIQIANAANQLTLHTYPVPTGGLLNVEITFTGKKNLQYLVYNVLGQSVYETTESNVYSHTTELNLSFLTGGVYFLQVTDGTDTVLKRIVKQ